MKATAALLLIISCALISCSKPSGQSAVLIRIDNQTDSRLEDVVIYPYNREAGNSQKLRFSSVDAGTATIYRPHPALSSVFTYEFFMEGNGRVETQLRCGNEESDLPPGKYSIIISQERDYPEVYLRLD